LAAIILLPITADPIVQKIPDQVRQIFNLECKSIQLSNSWILGLQCSFALSRSLHIKFTGQCVAVDVSLVLSAYSIRAQETTPDMALYIL
jgi:hypothetical protein